MSDKNGIPNPLVAVRLQIALKVSGNASVAAYMDLKMHMFVVSFPGGRVPMEMRNELYKGCLPTASMLMSGRSVELYNACSVDIGGGRSQEGDRAGGTPASSQMYFFISFTYLRHLTGVVWILLLFSIRE